MSPKKLNPKKVSSVDRIKELLAESKSVAVVDYKGLKVSQATELRRAVKKAGGQVLVTKNSLFLLALKAGDKLKLATELTGPSAFVFSLSDEISAIKTVADYAKKNSLPAFKLGFLSDRQLTASDLATLASLPPKNTLIAQTVTALNSPLFRLVYGLNWNLSKLVLTLNAVKIKKAG